MYSRGFLDSVSGGSEGGIGGSGGGFKIVWFLGIGRYLRIVIWSKQSRRESIAVHIEYGYHTGQTTNSIGINEDVSEMSVKNRKDVVSTRKNADSKHVAPIYVPHPKRAAKLPSIQ